MISSNPFLFTCFLMTLISMCHAVTLTYKIAAQERACFYTDSQVINEKFAFYFAVIDQIHIHLIFLTHKCINNPFLPSRFNQGDNLILIGKFFHQLVNQYTVVQKHVKVTTSFHQKVHTFYYIHPSIHPFKFHLKEVGEYAFCFSNSMSTFSQKIVDFDIRFKNPTSFSSNTTPPFNSIHIIVQSMK